MFRLFCLVKFYQFIEQIYVIKTYYRKFRFFLVDMALFFLYFFMNPYRISKSYLKKRGEKNLHVYGETPLSSLEKICKRVGVTANDHVVDLGSGRGRGCFWLANYLGCKATGIEQIPRFVKVAKGIQFFSSSRVEFICSDYQEFSFSKVSVVYLYGTALKEHEIERLTEKLKELPLQAKVISISFPLNAPFLEIKESFSISFPWGETEGYLHEKIHPKDTKKLSP